MLGKQDVPEDAIRRWSDQVSTLKICLTFRELRGLDGDPIDFGWQFSQEPKYGYSPQNSSRLTREEHQT